MTSEKTYISAGKDRLQGAVDAVNNAGRRFHVVGESAARAAVSIQGLKSLITPSPVEARAEIAPCDDLSSLPGVKS